MKKIFFPIFYSLSLLLLLSHPVQAQTDRNRPKPKTPTTRGLGVEKPPPGAEKQLDSTSTPTPAPVTAQQISNRKRKVMVMDFDARGIPQWWGNWDVGSLFANVMVSRLSRSDIYDVVERERMKALIDEQNLSQDERFRQDKVTKIGQLLGADYVLFGYLTNFSRKKSNKVFYNEYSAAISFSVRLVDVGSSKVLKSAEVDYVSKDSKKVIGDDNKTFNPNDPDFLQSLFGKAINESVAQGIDRLTGGTESSIAQTVMASQKNLATPTVRTALVNDGKLRGFIAAVDGANVIINRGQSNGVKVGDVFEVTRGGITDPETGRILRPKVIAEIKITSVEDSSADGALTSQKEKVVAKDTIVLKAAKQ
ncbi:MAG TPA: CsgG/HfaB family protein [Pyrinomonadaceae bacterium]|nr:CsgG/HfaB family protein [Pyrinomonadaceae bacterium]